MCFTFDKDDLSDIKQGDTKFVRVLKTVMWTKRLDEKGLAEILNIEIEQVQKWLGGELYARLSSHAELVRQVKCRD